MSSEQRDSLWIVQTWWQVRGTVQEIVQVARAKKFGTLAAYLLILLGGAALVYIQYFPAAAPVPAESGSSRTEISAVAASATPQLVSSSAYSQQPSEEQPVANAEAESSVPAQPALEIAVGNACEADFVEFDASKVASAIRDDLRIRGGAETRGKILVAAGYISGNPMEDPGTSVRAYASFRYCDSKTDCRATMSCGHACLFSDSDRSRLANIGGAVDAIGHMIGESIRNNQKEGGFSCRE